MWSERCDRSSFSGSPAVRMMTQWLAQDCCASEGAIGLQSEWGGAGGWCWRRHYSSHSCYTVSLSLSLSETQSDVSELQDQRTFCQSLISSAALLWNLGYRKSVRRYGQYCRPDQEFSDHVLLVVLTKALNTLINAETCMCNSHEEYLNSGSLTRRHLFLLLNDQTWKKNV